MPDGTGVKLPAHANFSFQMHYTPYGKSTTDRSRLGIYFHDSTPKHVLDGTVLINFRFRIPPHASDHQDQASFTFERDALSLEGVSAAGGLTLPVDSSGELFSAAAKSQGNVVPEPSALALMAIGIGVLMRRRRR